MERNKFPDRNRVAIPEKPTHPQGWNCTNCYHVVKDNTPGSRQMKCCRNPPSAQAIIANGQFVGAVTLYPAVNDGEWCGEFRSLMPV